MVCIIPRP